MSKLLECMVCEKQHQIGRRYDHKYILPYINAEEDLMIQINKLDSIVPQLKGVWK